MTAGDAPALEKSPFHGSLGRCAYPAVADRLCIERCAPSRLSCAKELPRTVIRLKEQCANGSPLRQIPTERFRKAQSNRCCQPDSHARIERQFRGYARPEELRFSGHTHTQQTLVSVPSKMDPGAVDIVTADYVGELSVPSASFSDLYPAKRPRSFQVPYSTRPVPTRWLFRRPRSRYTDVSETQSGDDEEELSHHRDATQVTALSLGSLGLIRTSGTSRNIRGRRRLLAQDTDEVMIHRTPSSPGPVPVWAVLPRASSAFAPRRARGSKQAYPR
jgi:hypothetical protein